MSFGQALSLDLVSSKKRPPWARRSSPLLGKDGATWAQPPPRAVAGASRCPQQRNDRPQVSPRPAPQKLAQAPASSPLLSFIHFTRSLFPPPPRLSTPPSPRPSPDALSTPLPSSFNKLAMGQLTGTADVNAIEAPVTWKAYMMCVLPLQLETSASALVASRRAST